MTLPSFDEHTLQEIEKALRSLPRRVIPGHTPEERRAAVLVSLCTVGGEPSFLFTKRTDDVPTHKGQVAFPGGMTDPGDKDPVATAVRETTEEVGFPESSIRVLGMSHDVRAITGVPVTPVIGFLGEIPEPAALSVEQREIAATFTLTLRELMNPDTRRRVQHEPRGSYPVFESGPWPVWGLTAYMLDEFLRDILHIDLWQQPVDD